MTGEPTRTRRRTSIQLCSQCARVKILQALPSRLQAVYLAKGVRDTVSDQLNAIPSASRWQLVRCMTSLHNGHATTVEVYQALCWVLLREAAYFGCEMVMILSYHLACWELSLSLAQRVVFLCQQAFIAGVLMKRHVNCVILLHQIDGGVFLIRSMDCCKVQQGYVAQWCCRTCLVAHFK